MTRRFPPQVLDVLTSAGWLPGRRDDDQARNWALRLAGYATEDGRQHRVVPAAVEAYAEFGGVRVPATGDGEQVASSPFNLDPFETLHTVATLDALAQAIGAPLTPLGTEGDGVGILAIDEKGRVFVLDHGGDWFLGDSLDEALTVLVLGRQPARVGEDGTW